jgi:hypothetical protein
MTVLMNAAGQPLRLERETCSRCGGSGHHSYCSMYGSTCFKCAGRKEVLTKRGAAASAYLRQLRSKPLAEVKVGDVVKLGGVTGSGTPYDVWCRVTKIEPSVSEGSSLVNGVMTPYRHETLTLTGTHKGQEHGLCADPNHSIELCLSREEQVRTLELAIAYQNTLTKMGKPRKVRQVRQ